MSFTTQFYTPCQSKKNIIVLAQVDTAGNAKLDTDWQQAPIFVWEFFMAISNFLVRRQKKIRQASSIFGAILVFFTMK